MASKAFPGNIAQKTAPTGAATALSAVSIACERGVLVQASKSNTGVVYIGNVGVTAQTGIELSAGESIYIPIDDPADIYCLGSIADQTVRGMAL